ncbi:glycosyltransferase [Brucella intermedia]|uniref:glycosyltransferase n=1 Tax=Brucella intermedia TaxID=94625 RepID=UPI00224AEEF2|nr:glycosyltransferase [Brucella intermedia]
MSKILSIYVNCSRGGMGTVYLNRAINNPSEHHTLIFVNDKGGYHLFTGHPNIDVRIIRKDRLKPYIAYLTVNFPFDEIRITSLPEAVEPISKQFNPKIVYEFHTSVPEIVSSELAKFDIANINSIYVPSEFSRQMLLEQLPPEVNNLVEVRANQLNTNNVDFQPRDRFIFRDQIPILWIGRFDAGKNTRDFMRILSQLPELYIGIVVVSLESDPSRLDDFLSDAFAYGVEDRVKVYLNLSHEQVFSLYSSVSRHNGYYCSTSLNESFGFTVVEAATQKLRVVGYDVGALSEHQSNLITLFPVGDNQAIVNHILETSSPAREPLYA